ncbi:hypothetical protein GIB67_007542, partial [Kingdonia uniflora]
MVVALVVKTNIVFFNQEEVIGETHQASTNQTTVVSVEEQTLKVEKTEYEASQTKVSKDELVLMESEVNVTLKKRHALNEDEINEIAFNMACRMNQLPAPFDDLLSGVLLESLIQRPISQD